MKMAIPKERRADERRVAVAPDTVIKLINLGFSVTVEKNAGESAGFSDSAYKQAGASIAATALSACKSAEIILKVQGPDFAELKHYNKGAILIAHLNALSDCKGIAAIAKAGITGLAMEMMPRITRAQSMDVLSSQSDYLAMQPPCKTSIRCDQN